MIVGTVAEIGENMLGFDKRRLADPGHALAAHMGVGMGVAAHPHRHEVTADAGGGAAAFRHAGGGVMRTAGTKPRLTREIGRRRFEQAFLVNDLSETGGDLGIVEKPADAFHDRLRDHTW